MRRTPSGVLVFQEPEHVHKGFRYEINKMEGYWHGVAVSVDKDNPENSVGFKAVGVDHNDVGDQLTILVDHYRNMTDGKKQRKIEVSN